MSFHGSAGATALVGMPGFAVGAQVEVDGEWWLYVQTTAETVACPDAALGRRGTGGGT